MVSTMKFVDLLRVLSKFLVETIPTRFFSLISRKEKPIYSMNIEAGSICSDIVMSF